MALAIVFALLSALGFGSGNILMRIGTQRLSAPTATFFAVSSGAVVLVCLAFAVELPGIMSLPPVAWAWFALMGAMAYPMARVLINSSITMIGASRAAPMSSFQPIFALGLGMTILGERPNLLVGLGTPVVAVGLILVFLAGTIGDFRGTVLSRESLGYLLALGGAAAFASRDVISRHVVSGVAPPLVTAAFALALGGFMLFALTHRDVVKNLRRVPSRHVVICSVAGIVLGLAVASLFQALSRAPVTVVSPINASNPLITLALAHFFLRRLESISLLLVVGTLLSVGGVAMVILGAAA
ncbi:MAG TPA: DMT family transporter [Dehalococcoidia bacterium]|nr:DMT family transporter [Dehalococcoidia bacterium]